MSFYRPKLEDSELWMSYFDHNFQLFVVLVGQSFGWFEQDCVKVELNISRC